jgi:hypothetical protein
MATITTTMQTRLTARGAELTSVKAETGYDFFERHPIIRALCPDWIFAYYD